MRPSSVAPARRHEAEALTAAKVIPDIAERIRVELFLTPERDWRDVIRRETAHLPEDLRRAVISLISVGYDLGQDDAAAPVIDLTATPANALPGIVDPPESMLLEAKEIREIHELCMVSGMATTSQDVDALLSGLSPQIRGTLPHSTVPRNRLFQVLSALNWRGQLKRNGSEPPLLTVVETAVVFLSSSQRFDDVAETLRGYAARIEAAWSNVRSGSAASP